MTRYKPIRAYRTSKTCKSAALAFYMASYLATATGEAM